MIMKNYGCVDLGLPSGTKWATCNVGATSPEEYGNYYAWGETTTKDTYSWGTYKYGSDPTKYNSTDKLTTLEAADDAATANWGKEWRTPTSAEWQELIDNCTWNWIINYNETGVKGYIFTSKTNGNTIFLPAAGYHLYADLCGVGIYGFYLSSSLDTDDPYCARNAYFNSHTVWGDIDSRYCGQSVRPVLK